MGKGVAGMTMGAVVDDHAQPADLARYRAEFNPCMSIQEADGARLADLDVLLVDVDMGDARKVLALKERVLPHVKARHRIMLIERRIFGFVSQANGLGATAVLTRPFDVDLFRDIVGSDRVAETAAAPPTTDPTGKMSIGHAAEALGSMFASLDHADLLDMASVNEASDEIISAVASTGLDRWLNTVRSHHVGTFQHCLIVTGVASAFATAVGMREADARRLTAAAMLHDIGKARIPLEILNKTGKLDPAEFDIMKLHPVYGYDYLKTQPGITEDILDCVRHHHEYLDGSGYPDGLKGSEITDITRVLTVCDIYGALIEKRAYKRPRSPEESIAILEEMAVSGKLELGLVRALAIAVEADLNHRPAR